MRKFVALAALAACPSPADAVRAATPASLDFARTFGADDCGGAGRCGFPRTSTHYVAQYRLDGAEHRVEVWRDGETRVRRRTDDALDTLVTRPSGSDEWHMTVLDLKRRIRTDIDRTNLLRVGHFSDWFAQAHSFARPRGDYRLTAVGAPVDVAPAGRCRWYRIEQPARTTTLCWSADAGAPLMIVAADGTIVWRVVKLATGRLPADAFAIDDRGFVRNDADADIQAD